MSQLTTTPMVQSCHIYIKKTAMEMCAAVYEEAAKDNKFHKDHPDVRAFQVKYWSMYINAARETLVSMLANPAISEHMKEEICDIIIKDRSLQSLPPLGNS